MKEKINVKLNLNFTAVLTLIFITLKLCGVITWSWLWVLAPLWIGWAVVLLVIGVVALWAFLYDRFYW